MATVLDASLVEVLEGTNDYYIQQRIRWGEAITQGCWEQKNIYDIYEKESKKKIFVLKEESNDWSRCCCAPVHSLFVRFYLVDEAGNEVGSPIMTMEREGCDCCCAPCPKPLICCWACKPECSDKSVLYAGDFEADAVPGSEKGALRDKEKLLGATVQPINGGKFKPVLQIMERGEDTAGEGGEADSNLEPKLTQFAAIRGPCFFGGLLELCFHSEFGISKSKDGMGVDEIHQLAFDHAKITKVKPDTVTGALREAFTDSDIYTVEFLEEGTTPLQKANVLASMILVDYMFFERDNDVLSDQNSDGITITFCNCFCYGCICPCKVTFGGSSGD